MTREEIEALESVISYLDEEEQDAEASPALNHIWKSVSVLKRYLDDLHFRMVFSIILGSMIVTLSLEVLKVVFKLCPK